MALDYLMALGDEAWRRRALEQVPLKKIKKIKKQVLLRRRALQKVPLKKKNWSCCVCPHAAYRR